MLRQSSAQVAESILDRGSRGIGIIGARVLPDIFRDQVSGVVRYLLSRDYHIHSGGALGADLFALQTLVEQSAFSRGVIFSPWVSVSGFPRAVQPFVEQFISHDGRVDWGMTRPHSSRSLVVIGLLSRNRRLVDASSGLVAFLYGESRGTVGTILQAIQRGLRVVVFVCGGGAELPRVSSGVWRQLRCSGTCWSGAFIFRPD
jgi:hypothetical protein